MPPRRKKPRAKTERLELEKIEIDFVILADFAQAVVGKLNLIGGGWNLHNAVAYPSSFLLGVGIGVLVPWPETNRKHGLQFEIRKSEGAVILKGSGEYEVGREVSIPAGMKQRVTLGISAPIQLPEAGTYEVIVTTADQEKRITFEALPATKR